MGWASLPAEVLALCYAYTQQARIDDKSSVLKDRLRGEAVCQHWRAVLRELPFEELRVEGPLPEGARRWLAAAKPSVHSLRCFGREQNTPPARLEELLSALAPQVLLQLEWGLAAPLPATLPCPGILPSLRSLEVASFEWDQAWLEALAEGLPALQRLALRVIHHPEEYWEGDATEPAALPPLLHLTRLELELADSTLLRVVLADLPALVELDIRGREAAVEVVGASGAAGGGGPLGAAPSAVARLTLCMGTASVDFGALPALRCAALSCSELDGAETLAEAEGLRELRLESHAWQGAQSIDGWALEFLDAAPRTLCTLVLHGIWSTQVAEAVGRMAHLRALQLQRSFEPQGPGPLPPAGSPVWSSLRALEAHHLEKSDIAELSKGLRRATQLERLLLHLQNGIIPVGVLASMPALRHLALAVAGARWQKLQPTLRAALAHLETLIIPLEDAAVWRSFMGAALAVEEGEGREG